MLSAIAPVFRGDFLEGVAGLDITVGNLLEHIAHLDVPWDGYAMIVSAQMNIMALPSAGEEDFGLDELTSHSYNEAIRRELFKPEDFNLHKRPDTVAWHWPRPCRNATTACCRCHSTGASTWWPGTPSPPPSGTC